MVIILEKDGDEIVMVPVLLGIPVRRLKYISPELPLTLFNVTLVILAGLIIFISSLSEAGAEKAVPEKIIALSD